MKRGSLGPREGREWVYARLFGIRSPPVSIPLSMRPCSAGSQCSTLILSIQEMATVALTTTVNLLDRMECFTLVFPGSQQSLFTLKQSTQVLGHFAFLPVSFPPRAFSMWKVAPPKTANSDRGANLHPNEGRQRLYYVDTTPFVRQLRVCGSMPHYTGDYRQRPC